MVLMTLIMLYPFLHVISLSLSDPKLITRGLVSWYPQGINAEGYKLILENDYGNYMQLPPENERVGHHYYSIIKR